MGLNHGRTEAETTGNAVIELQKAMLCGQLTGSDPTAQRFAQRLEELQKRLERVRGWGGPYREIEFSPEIKNKIATEKQMRGVTLASSVT